MTGVTRLARTSVLILLLIGVLSPVPVFATVLFDNSKADKIWDITLPSSIPLPGATDGHYVNFFKGILALGTHDRESPSVGPENAWVTTATTTTARIKKIGSYACDSMLIGTGGFAISGLTYNLDNNSNYRTDTTPPLSVGTDYCDFQFNYGGIPPGTPLVVAFLGTYNPHTIAGSDSNGGTSFDGLYGNPIPGGFAFQLCDAGGCSGGFSTTTTPTTTPSGPSSVLFLPGIESSRLYKPRALCIPTPLTDCADQLWEPNIDADVQDLFMNPDGTSVRSDIYTKDVVDSYSGTGNTDVYKSFSTFMDSEVTAHKVAAWKAAPYDWRYGIDTVVNGGVSSEGHISYSGTATSSYLVNQVLILASSSPAGKVTIIAHSNGGLVAKLLVNKLKEMGRGDLIDKIVFVAVPQLGTPKAIPSILHGYEQANAHGLVTRLATARELARNSPGAYTLLPSESYTSKVATPTVLFDPNSITTAGFRSYYGTALDSQSELENFLTGSLDQRPQPVSFSDTDTPIRVSSALLTHAKEIETTLASWTPPTNTKVYEVAGVGLDTLSGITYKDSCVRCLIFTQPHLSFEENTVLDGDGTVVAGSALDGGGQKYYFNISDFKSATNIKINHATIMGASSVEGIIDSALVATTSNIGVLPSFISASSPDFSQKKHLVYRIHSPVSLDLYDNQGHHTGIATTTLPNGTTLSYINDGIPGATYDEFGEVKYAFSDAETPLHIVMNGLASGYVTYDILEMTGNIVTATTTFVNIPVATTTRITMDIQGSINTASPLHIDENGDGINEYNLAPKLNDIIEIPKPVLQIVPNTKEIQLGSGIGILTANLTGFQVGDTASTTVSGTASCTTTATSASPVGTYPITCTRGTLISDKYSFATTTSGMLRITYRFDGFLQPINDTAHQVALAKSVFKAGSTVPVKVQIKKADGSTVQSVTSPVWLAPQKGSVMSASVDENVYPDAGTTGTTFKWDSTSQQYIYNWGTKGLASGYWYKISAQADDGSTFTVVIGLK